MLSKAQSKYIRSLSLAKARNEHGAFVVEGGKVALEWLAQGTGIKMVVATPEWSGQWREMIDRHPGAEVILVKESELEALSTLKTANQVLLVVQIPAAEVIPPISGWCMALDDIRDPGNMGTLIRIADWFGVPAIVCSPGCADRYNPKVVQSAMGSHLRVQIFEADLPGFLKGSPLPKIAATLQGNNVYHMSRMDSGILIIGNESRGISMPVLAQATTQVTIPRRGGAESLNAGVSAGILLALLLPC